MTERFLLLVAVSIVLATSGARVECRQANLLRQSRPNFKYSPDGENNTDQGSWPWASPPEELAYSSPYRRFVVMVDIQRNNTNSTTACHGTVLSDRLLLMPSLCLGNIRKYPIRKVNVWNVTLNPFDISSMFEISKRFPPKYDHLSEVSDVCVAGREGQPEKLGRLSVLRLQTPLTSFEQLLRPKGKFVENPDEFEGSLMLCSLNVTNIFAFAPVKETKCPKRVQDDTIACYERHKRTDFGYLESPWTHVQGICHTNIGAPIVGGPENNRTLYGILGQPRRLCYDRYLYAADVQKLSAQIDRLIKLCSD